MLWLIRFFMILCCLLVILYFIMCLLIICLRRMFKWELFVWFWTFLGGGGVSARFFRMGMIWWWRFCLQLMLGARCWGMFWMIILGFSRRGGCMLGFWMLRVCGFIWLGGLGIIGMLILWRRLLVIMGWIFGMIMGFCNWDIVRIFLWFVEHLLARSGCLHSGVYYVVDQQIES